jgi:hypothetical protein
MIPVDPRLTARMQGEHAAHSDRPQGLRPEIARVIEALARAAVRREDRRANASEGQGK